MITAAKMQYEFRRRFNRINSSSGRYVSVPEIDSLLTEGLYIYFENRAAIAETNPLVRNDLRAYEYKRESLSCQKVDDQCCFAEYPKDFYQLLRTVVVASGIECGNKIELLTHIIKSDDISESLASPFWKPSYNWEETFVDKNQDGLLIYYNGAFNVSDVKIDYYKKPDVIQTPSLTEAGSYIDADGNNVSSDKGLKLDSTFAWRKIVDIAVLIASRDVGDSSEFQTQMQKMLQMEKIHLQ